ncbi:hypothetical protein D1AOALGA4SA_969 [Olavius algarvensis Delta 1 endosymbiont]|nr:hypothetical protein D1AOALGA4SA_969 [Olavius algarvensis Delta 1 endosymbiont]
MLQKKGEKLWIRERNLWTFCIEWTHKRKNSHYISMIR